MGRCSRRLRGRRGVQVLGAGMERAAAPSGAASPAQPRSYEDDPDMDRLFKKFRKPDPDHAVIHALPGPALFTLRDTQQKVVLLQGEQLVAASAASNVSAAEIKVMPNTVVEAHYPIFLGVENRSLSCGTSKDPVLQLEDRDINSVYNDKSQNLSYTFTNLKTGNTHQFESLAYRGWFLCTSQRNNEALSITNRPGEKQITTFYFTASSG